MGKEFRRRIYIILYYFVFGGNGWLERVFIDLEFKVEVEEFVVFFFLSEEREVGFCRFFLGVFLS